MRHWWLPLLLLGLGAAGVGATAATHGAPSERPQVRCERRVNPGADIGKAIRRAHGGTTICLRGGGYPTVVAADVDKSPPVTVRSVPGAEARVDGIELENASGLRFVALHLTEGVSATPAGGRLAFVHNRITGRRGIYLFGDYRIGDRIADVRIIGNRIHHIDYGGTQETGYGYGIEGVGDVRHVLVAGNTIKSPASDYMQSASPVDWKVEDNTFLGPSLLGSHEDHQDLWQIFGGGTDITFAGNVARHTQTQESLLFQEGAFRRVRVVDNLFVNDSRGYTCQIYQSSGLLFRRNTIVGSRWGCLFRDLASAGPGGGYRVERNIFAETRDGPGISLEGRAGAWGRFAENVSDDGSAGGPGSVRHWRPRWRNRATYPPIGLPYPAGYHPG